MHHAWLCFTSSLNYVEDNLFMPLFMPLKNVEYKSLQIIVPSTIYSLTFPR